MFIPVHFLSNELKLPYPYYISNISSGLLFYSCGYWLRDIKFGKITTFILLVSYCIMSVISPVCVDMRSGTSVMGPYLLWVPYVLLGILSFNALASHIADSRNVLSRIGADTMPYYCLHWPVIILVSIFFRNNGLPDTTFLICMLAANIVLLPTITKLLYKHNCRTTLGL